MTPHVWGRSAADLHVSGKPTNCKSSHRRRVIGQPNVGEPACGNKVGVPLHVHAASHCAGGGGGPGSGTLAILCARCCPWSGRWSGRLLAHPVLTPSPPILPKPPQQYASTAREWHVASTHGCARPTHTCHETLIAKRVRARPTKPRPNTMSLNGLDSPAVQDAYQHATAESGGWSVGPHSSGGACRSAGRVHAECV